MTTSITHNNLKAIRLEQGFTQRQVASLLGLQCESRLSQWENGTSMPSVQNAFKLAEIYKTPLKHLFNLK